MRKLNQKDAIGVASALIVLAVLFVVLPFYLERSKDSVTGVRSSVVPQTNVRAVESETKPMMTSEVIGTGKEAKTGSTVSVHYTGMFTSGEVFDSSLSRGVPFTFRLGDGMVIKGWDEGIVGMKVGGKRVLTVPPELGYGASDYGPIPGNSTLIFEVELLEVK